MVIILAAAFWQLLVRQNASSQTADQHLAMTRLINVKLIKVSISAADLLATAGTSAKQLLKMVIDAITNMI